MNYKDDNNNTNLNVKEDVSVDNSTLDKEKEQEANKILTETVNSTKPHSFKNMNRGGKVACAVALSLALISGIAYKSMHKPAIVGNKIYVDRMDKELMPYLAQYKPMALQKYLTEKAYYEYAKELKVSVSEKEIDTELANRKGKFKGSDAEWCQSLGTDMKTIKSYIKLELINNKLQEKIGQTVKITPPKSGMTTIYTIKYTRINIKDQESYVYMQTNFKPDDSKKCFEEFAKKYGTTTDTITYDQCDDSNQFIDKILQCKNGDIINTPIVARVESISKKETKFTPTKNMKDKKAREQIQSYVESYVNKYKIVTEATEQASKMQEEKTKAKGDTSSNEGAKKQDESAEQSKETKDSSNNDKK